MFPHRAGIDQSAGEQLIHGEDIPVAASLLLGQHPLVEVGPVTVLGAVFVEGLSLQAGAVIVRLGHLQVISQRPCQILHPLHIVRPVVQGHIGHRRTVHLFFCRVHRRLGAAAQQQTGQQGRQDSLFHRTSFQKERSLRPRSFFTG